MSNTLMANDDILCDEYDHMIGSTDNEKSSVFTKLKQITSVSEVLRIFGACAVIASMSLFLLNGWSEGNDIQRYLKLLMQTGLLTGAGVALSLALKENKGARLFFALSLVSVVANFTILGALTYSMFQLDGNLTQYPSMVTWSAISASTFWPVFAGAVTLLAILTRFSFSIFARNISGPLSLNFIAMSSLLLIPVRGSLAVSVIALGALWASAALVKKLSRNEKVVFTNETKFALGLMFVPGLLIIARALSLYNVDEVMLITLSGLSYLSLRSWLVRFTKPSLALRLIEITQLCLGVFMSIQLTELLPYSAHTISGLLFSALVLILSFDQIRRSGDNKWKQTVLNLTTIGLVLFNVIFATFSSSILLQAGSLLTCIALFSFANAQALFENDNRFSKVTAIIGIVFSLFVLASHLINLINVGNWVVLGLIGVALIVGGSLYERFGLTLFRSTKLNS